MAGPDLVALALAELSAGTAPRYVLAALLREGVRLGLAAALARICDAPVVPENGHATLEAAEWAVRAIDPAQVARDG